MLEIKNIRVYDLKECVIASRNPMRTELPEYTDEEFEASLKRAFSLVQASKKDKRVKCHDNFLTGIRVSFDVIYTQYITKELQRYHWFDYVSSSSCMHRLMHMNIDKACNKYTSQSQIDQLKKDIARYNRIAADDNFEFYKFTLRDGTEITDTIKKDALYHARIIAMSDCPMGLELFTRVSTNYKQLQTMYFQREGHRLREDWENFRSFVMSLPYAKELILGEIDGEENNESNG